MESNLRPVASIPTPNYPAQGPRMNGVRLWLKRAAASAATVFAMTGCYASTGTGVEEEQPTTPESLDPYAVISPPMVASPVEGYDVEACATDPEPRLSGDMAPIQHFFCGSEPPDEAHLFGLPVYLASGQVCADLTAWATLEVTEEVRVRAMMFYGQEEVVNLGLIAPTGNLVAELGPESCLELSLTPGEWTLAASPVDPETGDGASFEFAIDEVTETE